MSILSAIPTLTLVIDFSRSFDLAWQRMVLILFQPFDLGKWFVIGFCAFLSGLLNGGNGFNFSGNVNSPGSSVTQQQANIHNQMTHAAAWLSAFQVWTMVMLFVVITLFVLGIVVLFAWLGARGQFLFLDNIVRNRGAVAWPWRAYARQGNRVFLFHLLCFAISLVIMLVLILPPILYALLFLPHHPGFGVGSFVALLTWFLVLLVVFLSYAVVISLFHDWAIPLMFRHDITAVAALRELGSMMKRHPGSIALFVLLRIALGIGMVVVGLLACCLTCCLELIPYLGTVILLPALVFVRCFSLECLAQFGPEYNVWIVDEQPPDLAGFIPLRPPV